MPKAPYDPCIPTRGTAVPVGQDWLHEVKYDGYRLTVQRDGKRVRLFTRNGHDWTDRYPLIVESALRNKSNSFVIDGEDFYRRRSLSIERIPRGGRTRESLYNPIDTESGRFKKTRPFPADNASRP
jgi:ATP dependent DNA ligase domain